MTGHPDDGLPLHAQIANAEFRLAFLLEKRETFLRQGRIAKRGFLIMLVVLAVLVPYLAITTQSDPVPTLAVTAILVGTVGTLMWIFRDAEWRVGDPNQLFGYNRYTSYVAFVEEAIQENEKRLTELKART